MHNPSVLGMVITILLKKMQILFRYFDEKREVLCEASVHCDESNPVKLLRERIVTKCSERMGGFSADEILELRLGDVLLPDELSLEEVGACDGCVLSVSRFVNTIYTCVIVLLTLLPEHVMRAISFLEQLVERR